jgi:hypothetical protein
MGPRTDFPPDSAGIDDGIIAFHASESSPPQIPNHAIRDRFFSPRQTGSIAIPCLQPNVGGIQGGPDALSIANTLIIVMQNTGDRLPWR